jgi:hypothetical protein
MRIINILTLCCLLAGIGCNSSGAEKRVSLFNGKDLTGWDTYIGPSYDTIQNKWDTIPQGLNNDPLKVFSVVSEDDKPALRISGERFGGISTTTEYENYHLTLEFKWGKQKWAPRKDQKRDSGVLYHATGRYGADFGFWMRSQEFQIQEGDCGDYWGVAGGIFDVAAQQIDSSVYQYDPSAKVLTFSAESPNGRRCVKNPDAEKPSGDWNVLEIYCFGDTAVHRVNGVTVMTLYHSRQSDGTTESPLVKGKIQIQSEGAEIFYRNISIAGIDQLPELTEKQ